MNKLLFYCGFLVIVSCGRSSKSSVVGTWDYSRPIKEDRENEINIDIDGYLDSQASKIRKKHEAEGLEHFYLRFDEDGNLTEYKAGFAIEFNYRISNDTIFTEVGPYYGILKVSKNELTLKKIQGGNITTYNKVKVDLSDYEMAN